MRGVRTVSEFPPAWSLWLCSNQRLALATAARVCLLMSVDDALELYSALSFRFQDGQNSSEGKHPLVAAASFGWGQLRTRMGEPGQQ
jgi:hypothetical protein